MQIWKNKELKYIKIGILSQKGDDIFVTFELNTLAPKRIYKYKVDHINQFYEFEYDLTWKLQ